MLNWKRLISVIVVLTIVVYGAINLSINPAIFITNPIFYNNKETHTKEMAIKETPIKEMHAKKTYTREHKWNETVLTSPCFRNAHNYEFDFTGTNDCWEFFKESNRIKRKVISPDTALCAFEPVRAKHYKRKKKTVVLGIGAHLGPAANGKINCHCADMEFISWEMRDKDHGDLKNLLLHGYSKEHLKSTQIAFWERYHNDNDLIRADIIVCGFDTWHCFIFAPFNKKMVLNSAYRFDGHIEISKENMINLQSVFYQAVRYNPDVILAGVIVYDVMYHQHFLGSHKMIPLPATGEYVHQRVKKEINDGKCRGIPINTTGYHPQDMTISIFPKRLSAGGRIVAQELLTYLTRRKTKYRIEIMEKEVHGFNYCDLGKYKAVIMLGYSVMSYFGSEVASLGIPMFVPSPRLYAEWEKKFHLILERKNPLEQMSFNYMKESPRSLNLGYNPNDDFDMVSLERWVGYADYYYYEGTEQFDNYNELYEKIESSDLKRMNEDMIKHRIENTIRTHWHWKSIDKYFHGIENDLKESSAVPNTLAEGIKLWESKIARLNFHPDSKRTETVDDRTWVIVDYDIYSEQFGKLPKCHNTLKYRIVFFRHENSTNSFKPNSCDVINLENITHGIPSILKVTQALSTWKSFRSLHLLFMLIYATQHGATAIVHLLKGQQLAKGCEINSQLSDIIQGSSLWKQRTYHADQYWYAWTPLDREISPLWVTTLSTYIDHSPQTECMSLDSSIQKFSSEEKMQLENYLEYWNTDETLEFFHIIDQLNFELAVRGYMSKIYAEIYRLWLKHLVGCNFFKMPTIKKLKTATT